MFRVSRPGEFHPEALAEPDRTLSRHPAPIKEPLRMVPSVQTTLAADALASRASVGHTEHVLAVSCISVWPSGPVRDPVVVQSSQAHYGRTCRSIGTNRVQRG